MINYGKVISKIVPPEIQMTPNYIYTATNVETITRILDEEETIYQYDYTQYTKDEYINYLSISNAQAIDDLTDQLAATKILLGVE